MHCESEVGVSLGIEEQPNHLGVVREARPVEELWVRIESARGLVARSLQPSLHQKQIARLHRGHQRLERDGHHTRGRATVARATCHCAYARVHQMAVVRAAGQMRR